MYQYFYSYHKVLFMTKPLDRTGTWRTYSMADGLVGVRIEHIAEDNAKVISGSPPGTTAPVRFDGDEFQTFYPTGWSLWATSVNTCL